MRSSVAFSFAFCSIFLLVAGTEVPDEHADRILEETDRHIRSLFKRAPDAIYANQTHSYKKRISPEIMELGIRTAVFSYATDRLASIYNITRDEADRILEQRASPRPGFNANEICTRVAPSCNAQARYRLPDGSCNNLQRTTLGMAVVRFDRFLPSLYSNGNGGFRTSVTGEALLSPRIIRLIVHPDVSRFHNFASHMIVGFGQFLDHDITSTPEAQNLQCCNNRNNPECMAIDVPPNDDFYSNFGIQCIDIGRSTRACGTGQREQINQATSHIDCSMIYGSSLNEQNNLRSFSNGMLATDQNNRLLPKNPQAPNCGIPNQGITCFRAGDDRVNENPALTSMHTIWLREHNRIATGLRTINPQWSDEVLFQETKRIVVAEFQNIVYGEFLPVVLGSRVMGNFNLNLPPTGFTNYNSGALPVIFNEFATAAYRFGHSLIQPQLTMTGNGQVPLETSFQNPEVLYRSFANIDRIVHGLSQQPSQAYENFVTQAVTNHLFQRPGANFGTDLASLNIQRGRDHGLRPYNDYRATCNLARATSFDQLATASFFGNQDTANRFRDAYRDVNDIDLWPAGISEVPVPGGIVGDVFACIIGEQFQRLFTGDRHFFTHANQAGSFTENQLANLRTRTLAGVMCDNANPTVTSVQRNVFLTGGQQIPCANHPKLNLNNWRA